MEKIKEDTFSKSNYINYRVNILFYDEKKEEKIDANNIFEIKSLKLPRIDISKSINAKIESKGQKWRRFRESESQKFLDTRPATIVRIVSKELDSPVFLSRREVCAVKLLTRVERGCWFSGHVFRLAREIRKARLYGYGATGVPDGLLCHVRFQFSLLPFLSFRPFDSCQLARGTWSIDNLFHFSTFRFFGEEFSFFFERRVVSFVKES